MIELIYFTGKTCGVCKVLKPKLLEAVQENFPKVNIRVVDVEEEVSRGAAAPLPRAHPDARPRSRVADD